MAIEIKEYLGATFTENKDHPNFNPINLNLTESTHYSNRVAPNSLMVDIEGLHSIITRNDTFYTDKAMQESERYWTYPYERPVIMHHNEQDGITIGRVKRAYWTDKNTRSGTGALRFVTNIGHKEGLEGVNNGSLSTVSVGLIAHEVRCSICNQDLATEGECEHERGATYDGKRCYWIIHKFEPKELSFVIVPSDQYAHILKVYKPEAKALAESKNKDEVNNMFENPFLDLIEESNASIKDLTESKNKSKEEDEKAKKENKDKKPEESKEEEQEDDNINMQSEDGAQENKEDENKDSSEEEGNNSEEESKEDTKEDGEGNSESKSDEVNKEENKDESEEEKNDEDEDKSDEKSDESEEQKEESNNVDGKVIEEEVKKDIDSGKKDIYKDIERKLQDAEADKEELKKEIAALKKDLADTKTKLDVEKNLKESAETELIQFRTERKNSLVEQVNTLRTKANLEPEKVESLMEASEETLQFTIKNLTEFNSKLGDLSLIPKTDSNIAIEESKDNSQKKSSKKDVKENKTASNINLEESAVLDILSKAFGSGF